MLAQMPHSSIQSPILTQTGSYCVTTLCPKRPFGLSRNGKGKTSGAKRNFYWSGHVWIAVSLSPIATQWNSVGHSENMLPFAGSMLAGSHNTDWPELAQKATYFIPSRNIANDIANEIAMIMISYICMMIYIEPNLKKYKTRVQTCFFTILPANIYYRIQ